jgi:hypothetical protein
MKDISKLNTAKLCFITQFIPLEMYVYLCVRGTCRLQHQAIV